MRAIVVGLIAGVAISSATLALSTTDIGGPGWSLRGNGALVVEFAAAPAVLAAGWVGLSRGRQPGLAAGLLTLLLELIVGFGPILTRLDARLLLTVAAPLAALLAGVLLAGHPSPRRLLMPALFMGGLVLLSQVLPSLVFVLSPLLLPLIISAPSLSEWRRQAAGLIGLPLALVAGLLLGERLVA